MRRQGRQHGLVRTYPVMPAPFNPRPNRRTLNELSSPPAAGLFARVPAKPTNHSKFTGKCGRPKCRDCHSHPACKSRDKAKGAHKTRSSEDVATSHRLITWRVVDPTPRGLNVSGFSATGVLDYLGSEDCMDYDDHEDNYDDADGCDAPEISAHAIDLNDDDNNGDDDDKMSFYEVGFAWEPMDGDESWCLVEEM